jgi:hypothetical protein
MPAVKQFRAESESRLRESIAVIGILIEDDFEVATDLLVEFKDYCSYGDYIASRESLQLGLSTSGLVATIVYMRLSTLSLWRKFSSKPERDGGPVAHDLWFGTFADLTIDG